MKILVTGGSGLIGEGLIPALLESGHQVRILARHAKRDAGKWPADEVEGWQADVTDPGSLEGSADAHDVVVHVTGIARENPPEVTFEKVNVEGTRHVLAEAERAGAGRFIFVSSLGADRGSSDYHRSKRRAEELVRKFSGEWMILRPGNVYGPGDEVISTLMLLVRALPAIPLLDGGDQRFQPIWHEDLGRAIARVVDQDGLDGRILPLGGPEVTTPNDILDRIEKIEGTRIARIPVPGGVAELGLKWAERSGLTDLAAKLSGVDMPIDMNQLTMLLEENIVRAGERNALDELLGEATTPLDEGLRRLTDRLPEQEPASGIGDLEHKRFRAMITSSRLSAEELISMLATDWRDLLAVDVTDGPPPGTPLIRGSTITLRLPARGEVQVRVEKVEAGEIVLATVRGHPLAGVVRFSARPRGEDVRFDIDLHTRAANIADLLLMRARGDALQRSAWLETLSRVVDRSGGRAPEIDEDASVLDDIETDEVEGWIGHLVRGTEPEERRPEA